MSKMNLEGPSTQSLLYPQKKGTCQKKKHFSVEMEMPSWRIKNCFSEFYKT